MTEACPSGTVRNTPFLRLEHEIRPPQPEGAGPSRRPGKGPGFTAPKERRPSPPNAFIYHHPIFPI